MSDSENKLIKNYIAQVKQKLPEWLKWKEEELKNILNDLEQQLYNEARAISGGESLTDADVQEAIMRMGTPESIAKLYKRRGTPRFYITQELIEFYLRSLFFFFGVVFFVNILGAIFQFFFKVWWEVLGEMLTGIWIGCLISAVVITIVFVYFSMEGFLPEDFGIIPKRLAILFPFNFNEEQLEESKIYTKQKIQEAKVLREEKMAAFKYHVKEKMLETKAIEKEKLAAAKVLRKQKVEEAKLKREIGKTQPVTIGELIFGTSAGIIFGLILIIQPFAVTGLMQQAFLDWLKMMGFLIFVSGLFSLVRLVIGVSNYTGQQVFLVIGAIYNLAYIPLFVLLINQPEIFPISLFSGGNIPAIPADPTNIIFIVYFWVIIAIILGIMGGMIGNFFKVGKYSKLKKAY
ncbi:MAG: hypothetical protein CEE42_10060 [Promethearchaeota archaeon Loki_b31]|nr:MAG: hypothetical protein CEE42_10060 [Candidatus Lokiarchaeota archaeon Loki_b31]